MRIFVIYDMLVARQTHRINNNYTCFFFFFGGYARARRARIFVLNRKLQRHTTLCIFIFLHIQRVGSHADHFFLNWMFHFESLNAWTQR